ncbi:MAG: acylphosphatase [Thermoflexaceae bacterium]|nr:acylphosphatase [Thermoflexaceae bacterium]
MTVERRRIIVSGRVQGVGFRWFVRDVADELGLAGWVRNLPDGRTVEVLAEGPAAQLERLMEAVRRGPPGSYVAGCTETADPGSEPLSGFEITR